MRRILLFGLVPILLVVGVSCGEAEPEGPPTFAAYPRMTVDPERLYTAILTTGVGRMSFDLLPKEAPLAVNSFLFLAGQGYYDDVAFQRVRAGVLAETGDATGTGNGNAGYTFEIEAPQRPYARGMLAMANDGTPNSNGSRFFIILGDATANGDLPPDYTVFGVMKADHAPSERTLDAIEALPVGPGPDGELSKPQEQLMLVSVQTIMQCRQNYAYARCI